MKVICKSCNKETSVGNFCTQCGEKLEDVCEKCWIKNRCLEIYEEVI